MSKVKLEMPVEVYSRVVGYFRPVAQWNPGKKEEFKDRKTYNVLPVKEYEYQRD